MTEHTLGLDELHSLVVRLHGMLTDRQPGLSSWRETVSQFCLAIGDFGGIGKVSAMPDLLAACKALLAHEYAVRPAEHPSALEWFKEETLRGAEARHLADDAIALAEPEEKT